MAELEQLLEERPANNPLAASLKRSAPIIPIPLELPSRFQTFAMIALQVVVTLPTLPSTGIETHTRRPGILSNNTSFT